MTIYEILAWILSPIIVISLSIWAYKVESYDKSGACTLMAFLSFAFLVLSYTLIYTIVCNNTNDLRVEDTYVEVSKWEVMGGNVVVEYVDALGVKRFYQSTDVADLKSLENGGKVILNKWYKHVPFGVDQEGENVFISR